MKKSCFQRRVVLLLLSLAFSLGCLIGCGDKTPEVNPRDTTATSGGDGKEYDAMGYQKDSLPDYLNYGDTAIEILGWIPEYTEYHVEEMNGVALDEAVYVKDIAVEERLGVALNYTLIPGDIHNKGDFIASVDQAYSGGMPYDLVAAHTQTLAGCAIRGTMKNLGGIEDSYLDLSAPWWASNLLEATSIGDHFYFITGDISTSLVQLTSCVYFNMNLIHALNLESPYDLVDNNEWTLEKMLEMGMFYYEDTNDNKLVDAGDKVPFASAYYNWPMLLHGCNVSYVEKDSEGKFIISPTMRGEKAMRIMDLLRDFVQMDGGFVTSTDGECTDSFIQGDAIFLGAYSGKAAESFSDVEFEYGCVPIPKYDSRQEQYVCATRQPVTMYGLMANVDEARVSMNTAVLEALASKCYRSTTPVIFDSIMMYQASRSAKMTEMLQLIRACSWFDFGRIYTSSFGGWCDKPGSCLKAGTGTWEAFVTQELPGYEKLFHNFVANF